MVLSVITACYNHGKYLDEMIDSVKNYEWKFDYEHIIVNDGSTDVFTIELLNKVSNYDRVLVINQQNNGLAKARNAGLSVAKGTYILPLDSDNKIRPQIIEKGIEILDKNDSIDVLYTDAQYFEDKIGLWKVGNLNKEQLLIMNQIDACALIRKNNFSELGFYDELMPGMGNEDWELWIRFIVNSKRFYYLSEVGFDYRVSNSSSMSMTETRPKYDRIRKYLVEKYPLQYHDLAVALNLKNCSLIEMQEREYNSLVKTFIKKLYFKYFQKK